MAQMKLLALATVVVCKDAKTQKSFHMCQQIAALRPGVILFSTQSGIFTATCKPPGNNYLSLLPPHSI